MGQDLISEGFSAYRDRFSFLFFDKPIKNPPYLFESLLAYFVSIFGLELGYFILKLCAFALFLLSTYLFFKKNDIIWPAALLIFPFLVFFIISRSSVRPEIFSYALTVISLQLYLSAQKDFDHKRLIAIALLLLFWINYHTPIIGYILFFGLFVEKAICKMQNKASFSWYFWMSWGVILFSLGFIHPGSGHFFINTLLFSSRWTELIAEYFPATTHYSTGFVLSSILLTGILLLWLNKKNQYGLFIVVIILSVSAFEMYRLAVFYGIVSLLILSLILKEFIESSFFKKNIVIVSITYLIILVYGLHLNSTRFNHVKHNKLSKQFPVNVINFLNSNGSGGNIFNQFRYGGYLTYALGSNYKIFIDGRTNILYPVEHLEKYDVLLHNPSLFKDFFLDSNIRYIFYSLDPYIYSYFLKTGGFQMDYFDSNFMLLSRTNPHFPVTGLLKLKPACWTSEMKDDIHIEIDRLKLISHSNNELTNILEFLNSYFSYNNRTDYLQQLIIENIHYYSIIRIATYMAIEQNEKVIAINLLGKIKKRIIQDFLLAAHLNSELDNIDASLRVIRLISAIDWEAKGQTLLPHHKKIMLLILDKLSIKPGIDKEIRAHIKHLKDKIIKSKKFSDDNFTIVENLCLSDT